MIVKVINNDCYEIEDYKFPKEKRFFVHRIFEPELFLAITIAIIEQHGFQK